MVGPNNTADDGGGGAQGARAQGSHQGGDDKEDNGVRWDVDVDCSVDSIEMD